jgi:hypothetical protein
LITGINGIGREIGERKYIFAFAGSVILKLSSVLISISYLFP